MGLIAKYNTATLAKAVQPGIEALVASELDHLIDEAAEIAIKHVRENLVQKTTLKLQQSLERALHDETVNVKVDLTLGEK